MDGPKLQDTISRGMGVGARRSGVPFVIYRPNGTANPVASRNRVIKLYASFNAQDETYRRVSGYGQAVWWGVYDSSYSQPGDYLVGAAQTFFVSAQRPLLPVQCVLTNRIVNVIRTSVPVTGGYAGIVDAQVVPIITGWPASILATNPRMTGSSTETLFGQWTFLLPELPLALEAGDVVTDDLARSYVIGAAEHSDLGWRITVRQIAA